MRAYGNHYILLPWNYDGDDAYESNRRPYKLIFPEVGKTYDFTECEFAWVCGEQYNTVRNGRSSPVNVAGKKIRVTGFRRGDPYTFAMIEFEYVD